MKTNDLIALLATDTLQPQKPVRQQLLRQREAIEHTRLMGLSITETAERTGQSEASVKVNIHRGLKTLMAKWGAKT